MAEQGSRLRLQGTCEWMEGVLRPQGSQDISPPKDTTEEALPAHAPPVENTAAHLGASAVPDTAGSASAEEPAAEHAAPAEVGHSPMAEASCKWILPIIVPLNLPASC